MKILYLKCLMIKSNKILSARTSDYKLKLKWTRSIPYRILGAIAILRSMNRKDFI